MYKISIKYPESLPGIHVWIDTPSQNKLFCEKSNITFSGWAVNKSAPFKECFLVSDGGEKFPVPFIMERLGVKERYPNFYHADKPGFSFAIEFSYLLNATLILKLDSGESLNIDIRAQEINPFDKLVFIHIPKTAGSSFNEFINQFVSAESLINHLESKKDFHDPNYLATFGFVSGHLPIQRFSNLIDFDTAYSFTILRNPINHVISHINWVRRLSDPGEEQRLLNHPEYIQKLSAKLASTALSDATELANLIQNFEVAEYGLFDNTQTRYLCGKKGLLSNSDVNKALSNLSSLNRFGFVEDLNTLCNNIQGDLNYIPSIPLQKINESKVSYGLSSSDKYLLKVLSPLIEFDQQLYDQAQVFVKS